MTSRLMLFVGSRGTRIADMCAPLRDVADVVVVTSRDILDERSDQLDHDVAADVVVARTRSEVVGQALRFAQRTPVDGALSFSEDMIEDTARVCAELNLPGQPAETMPRFRDKYVQRQVLASAGIPTPAHARINAPDQAAGALAQVSLPAVLKPTRGSGGALAHVIDDATQLEPRVRTAFDEAGLAGGAVDHDTDFILEERLAGTNWHDVDGFAPYVSVESLASQGELTHLAVTDRFPLAPPTLETGMMLPSALRPHQRQQIVEVAGRALRALGFVHGVAHTELMLTADGPRIIEVNARMGGALPYLFPLASDLNIIAEAGRVALGLPPTPEATFTRQAVFVAPQHPVDAHVTGVAGLDEVAELPGVRAVIPLSVAGASTKAFRQTLIAAVLAVTENPERAVALWRDVMALVRCEYTYGEELEASI